MHCTSLVFEPPLPCPPPARQVPIFDILRKFDGQTVSEDVRAGRRRFRITRLPRFLILHVRRFVKNQVGAVPAWAGLSSPCTVPSPSVWVRL